MFEGEKHFCSVPIIFVEHDIVFLNQITPDVYYMKLLGHDANTYIFQSGSIQIFPVVKLSVPISVLCNACTTMYLLTFS